MKVESRSLSRERKDDHIQKSPSEMHIESNVKALHSRYDKYLSEIVRYPETIEYDKKHSDITVVNQKREFGNTYKSFDHKNSFRELNQNYTIETTDDPQQKRVSTFYSKRLKFQRSPRQFSHDHYHGQ